MSYAIEIVVVDPPALGAEAGMPTIRLPTLYDELAAAERAASAYLAEQHEKYPNAAPGSAYYRIVDDHGDLIARSSGTAP